MKRGTISQRLGVTTQGDKLTKSECLRKVRILTQGLKRGRYTGALRRYAVYYKNWYRWKSVHLKKRYS